MAAKPAKYCSAEVMSIGDEITSGHRLDTNTQWICQRLGELGIQVRFLSAVGDDLEDHAQVIANAIERVDLVVMTGGLGPTKDDLTREAIAKATGSQLELDSSELDRIKAIFERSGRSMPANNRTQAMFPSGSQPIPNPEGTAPGIDFTCLRENGSTVRILALPGVPAEMKQMWTATVEARLRQGFGSESIFCHHTLHCFGAGESQIEEMLPNLIERGRDPAVGITASQATISLRVATRGTSIADCQAKMQPTIEIIRTRLGDLVFGENGQTLAEVVASLLAGRNWRIAVWDLGLHGRLITELNNLQPEICSQWHADSATEWSPELPDLNWAGSGVSKETGNLPSSRARLETAQRTPDQTPSNAHEWFSGFDPWDDLKIQELAQSVRHRAGAELGLFIGPIDRNEAKVIQGQSYFRLGIVSPTGAEVHELKYWGHSAWRDERAVKQVLNQIRLFLRK